MISFRRAGFFLFFVVGLGAYAHAVSRLSEIPHRPALEEMRIAMPRFAQVLLAGGDRYFAANIATIRALVASTEGLSPDQFLIQGRVQRDAAWLNPAQQDNYHLAAGILSWNAQLEATQEILHQAHDARPMDLWPAFYYGFHEWHYNKKTMSGVHWLRLAAERAPSYVEQVTLLQIAARWASSTDDLGEAIRVVKNMADGTRDNAFRKYLLKRMARLEGLSQLRLAAKKFRDNNQRSLESLDELIRTGMLDSLPIDPFGEGFELDSEGLPVVAGSLKSRKG